MLQTIYFIATELKDKTAQLKKLHSEWIQLSISYRTSWESFDGVFSGVSKTC